MTSISYGTSLHHLAECFNQLTFWETSNLLTEGTMDSRPDRVLFSLFLLLLYFLFLFFFIEDCTTPQ